MTMNKPDFEKDILELLRSRRSPSVIRQELENFHANDIAAILPDLTAREQENLFHTLSLDRLAEVMEYAENAAQCMDGMNFKTAARILERMEPDSAADLLREMTFQKRNALLDLMSEKARVDLRMLASYDDDKIASKMTTNFIVVHADLTIREAIDTVIEQAAEHDNLSMIYVLDSNDIYYGAVTLQDLLVAKRTSDLESIISTAYPYVYADEDIDACLDILRDYSEDSIPVLSEKNEILGIITAHDLIEVVDDELGEDYAKLAGLTAEEDLAEPISQSIRKRIPWLVLLLGLGLVVSSVVGLFEGVMKELTLIVMFQSLILDMAGNVGTQSLAVTIRVLMDEKLSGAQKLKLVFKESRIGSLNGLLLGGLAVIGIGFYVYMFKDMSLGYSFAISGCVGLSLLIAMLASSLVGTVIPMAFHQVGIDPAVASGPLITTINDLVAVVVYYGFSWIFLVQCLHVS
ncbi:MAG: magnesium transporter [Eubacteriales bacterium]|nr:magnesium transporter [Eubacteriales bacterium]